MGGGKLAVVEICLLGDGGATTGGAGSAGAGAGTGTEEGVVIISPSSSPISPSSDIPRGRRPKFPGLAPPGCHDIVREVERVKRAF